MSLYFKRSLVKHDGEYFLIKNIKDDTLYHYLKELESIPLTQFKGLSKKMRTRFKDSHNYNAIKVVGNYKLHSDLKGPLTSRFTTNKTGGLVITDVYPLSEVVNWSDHWRMQMYLQKGYKCSNPACNKKGAYLVKSYEAYNLSGVHIDIVTSNFELMTVDHILPKSKGGNNSVENLRPMCERCNNELGSSMRY